MYYCLISLIITIITEYAWMFPNKQDSDYAYGPKYHKTLNMTKFWIWQGSQYPSVSRRSEYARICLAWQSSEYITGSECASILNMKQLYRVLNMPQYGWICLNWTWICLKMCEFTIINRLLNMYHTIHSARSLKNLMSIYWEIFRTSQRSKMERFGKNSILNLWEGSEYVSRSNYGRVLNIPGFWACQVSAYARIAKGSEYGWIMSYGRVLNIPG